MSRSGTASGPGGNALDAAIQATQGYLTGPQGGARLRALLRERGATAIRRARDAFETLRPVPMFAAAAALLALEHVQRSRGASAVLGTRTGGRTSHLIASIGAAIGQRARQGSEASVAMALVIAERLLVALQRGEALLARASREARRRRGAARDRIHRASVAASHLEARLSQSARTARRHAVLVRGRSGSALRSSAQGARRRAARVRDGSRGAIRAVRRSLSESAHASGRTARELSARISGTARRARRAADRLLAQRIRSRLLFVTTHAGAIDVRVVNGRAILSGLVLTREVSRVIASIRAVEGIKGVEQAWHRLDESREGILTLARGA